MRYLISLILLCLTSQWQAQTIFSTYGSACQNCVYPNNLVPSGCYRLTNIQVPSGLSACPGNPNNSPNNFCTFGQIWSSTCLNLSRPFTLNTTMYFGTEGTGYWGPGADGMCFVLKANPSPINTAQNGGMLGYTSTITPTANSLAVEFDTYLNGGNSIQNDPTDPNGASGDHVSVFRSGSLAHGSANELTPAVFVGQIEDGLPHNVIFAWVPSSQTFTVTLDGVTIINLVVDLPATLNTNTAYFGWTAASGWTGNVHWVCPNYTGVTTLATETFSNCESGVVELNANEVGSGNIQWYPSAGLSASTGATVMALQPGSYTARHVDGCGLVTEKLFVVENIPPTVTANDLEICQDDSWTLTPTGGNYTDLAWVNTLSPNDTTWGMTLSGSGSAEYQIIPFHNSCPNAGSPVTVSISEFIITPFSAGNDTSVCLENETFEFQLPINHLQFPADALLNWTTNNGNISSSNTQGQLTVGNSGIYTLTASFNNGCSASDSLIITLTNNPEFSIQGNDFLCAGETTDLSIVGLYDNIVWSDNSQNILSNSNVLTISQSGTYTLQALSAGCWGNDTLIVQEVAAINPNAGVNIDLCSNDPITLNGSAEPGYLLQWYTNNGNIIGALNTPSTQVSSSGTYYLQVTDSYGCAAFDDVDVSIHPIPVFQLIDDFSICPQTAFNVSIPTGVLYDNVLWQDGWNNATYNGTSGNNGIINLSATLSLGNCTYSDAVNITIYDLPNWSLPNDFQICFNNDIDVSSSLPVEWPNGLIQNNYSIAQPQVGNYSIPAILHYGVGCTMDDAIIINVLPLPTVSLSNDGDITCSHPLSLCIGQTNAANFTAIWEGNAQGNLPTPSPNPLNLSTATPDVYTLTILDNQSLCSNQSQITIDADLTTPNIQFSVADTLSCWTPQLSLNHYYVSEVNNYVVQWKTVDGYLSNDQLDDLWPTIEISGNYDLTVTNIDNGCSTTASTFIPESIDFGFDANEMVFPNIITRNNDQRNEFWGPFLKSNPNWDFYIYFEQFHMQVHNRWGSLVFESTPSQPYWNAKDVNAGNYFFTFEYTTLCGEKQSGKVDGTITVVE